MPVHDDWVRFPRGGAEANRRRRWRVLRQQRDVVSVMNDTRWRKLRTVMLGLRPLCPSYRIMSVEDGALTDWDSEWFYHFNLPSYAFIEWLELKPRNPSLRGVLYEALQRTHLPGEETSDGFRIFGYARSGRPVDYIR